MSEISELGLVFLSFALEDELVEGKSQARIQDFGQGGQWSFDPKGWGALSPKFAQNRGFSLKIV